MTHIAYIIENAWGEQLAVTLNSTILTTALKREQGLRVVGCVAVLLGINIHA